RNVTPLGQDGGSVRSCSGEQVSWRIEMMGCVHQFSSGKELFFLFDTQVSSARRSRVEVHAMSRRGEVSPTPDAGDRVPQRGVGSGASAGLVPQVLQVVGSHLG